MSDTASDMPGTQGAKKSHGESHASMSGQKSRRKSHIDTSDAFPQVRKSRGPEEKVTRPLPRKVTFSGLSLERPERDTERGEINKNPTAAEPADTTADDLAARQTTALDRLRRAHATSPIYRKDKP